MTEEEVINQIIKHTKKQFPRNCPCCGLRYELLRDFCELTTPIGNPVDYDMELGQMTPRNPMGAMALSNCRCGNTMALTSKGMSLLGYWRLLHWDTVR